MDEGLRLGGAMTTEARSLLFRLSVESSKRLPTSHVFGVMPGIQHGLRMEARLYSPIGARRNILSGFSCFLSRQANGAVSIRLLMGSGPIRVRSCLQIRRLLPS